ncbi:hypothetical protein ACHAXT_000593 [Thalassiosira profunda]
MSQAEFKRRLKALMLRPENQVCSDCPERQPRWASLIVPPPGAPQGSLPMGAFCCLECSGSHRRLGVHISFVRSVNLDSWKEKEVLAMENGGNQKVNAIFEARLSVAKPTNAASGPVRERFIRDKYERRKFYDPAAFEHVSQMETAREQDEVVSGVQRRLGSRKPSDAARKRVEERAAKTRSSGGAARSARSVKAPAPVFAPAPAPAPVVDLLDFGDFTSPEATSGVQASVVASATSSGTVANGSTGPKPASEDPQLDLFANMSAGATAGVANGGQVQQLQQQPEQKKMSNSDIMSMFNASSAHHNPMQQNMFAMQNGMAGGNFAMGQQQMMHQQQGMHQPQMGGAGMGGGQMYGQMMNQQQGMNAMNPPQQMGMMNNMQGMQMQGNMSNMQTQGMGSGNNMQMVAGQGQMRQMQNGMGTNNSMMMQGGGGGMMQGGNQFGQQFSMQAQQSPQKQQGGPQFSAQFSDFGNFGR